MRINYLILAHKSPQQLGRLIRALLLNNEHRAFVHIDSKINVDPFSCEMHDRCDGRLQFLDKRVEILWGRIQLVDATLTLLRESVKSCPDYHVLLSGQDFPIKPTQYISSFYERERGRNFIQFFPSNEDWSYRINHYFFPGSFYRKYKDFFVLLQRRIGINRSLILKKRGFIPYVGSAWWSLTQEAVLYILKFSEQNPWFYQFFKWSWCSDEMFFHTLLKNSPLAHTIVDNNYLYVDWPAGSHPRILESHDFVKIAAAKALYARKFDIEHDAEILRLIEERLLV